MGTGTGTSFYPRVQLRPGMANTHGYVRGRVFIIPNPNLTRCHPYTGQRIGFDDDQDEIEPSQL
jgi:hypothetical protein